MTREVGAGGVRITYELNRTVRQDVMLRVLPAGRVQVFAPQRARLRDIDRFVCEHIPEILRMREAVDESIARYRKAHPVCEGARIPVEGVPFIIHMHISARRMCRFGDGTLELYAPEGTQDDALRDVLRSALSKRALERIRERLSYYAPRIGVRYGRVAIREQKTRWGSCSSLHNLNFNWKLIMAPPEALDYVVIHELCHLIEFNHSKRFWDLVSGQMRDYEAWKKWLKAHGSELGV